MPVRCDEHIQQLFLWKQVGFERRNQSLRSVWSLQGPSHLYSSDYRNTKGGDRCHHNQSSYHYIRISFLLLADLRLLHVHLLGLACP